jgi:hypothetical protein
MVRHGARASAICRRTIFSSTGPAALPTGGLIRLRATSTIRPISSARRPGPVCPERPVTAANQHERQQAGRPAAASNTRSCRAGRCESNISLSISGAIHSFRSSRGPGISQAPAPSPPILAIPRSTSRASASAIGSSSGQCRARSSAMSAICPSRH